MPLFFYEKDYNINNLLEGRRETPCSRETISGRWTRSSRRLTPAPGSFFTAAAARARARVGLIVPERDETAFRLAAAGLEAEAEGGARCTECFVLRLSRTAEAAREGGYDYFATTLTVSPHKNAPLINAIGEKLAEDHGVLWLPSDFKKRDGYRRSIELSHEYGLYRQSWCGCGLPENF